MVSWGDTVVIEQGVFKWVQKSGNDHFIWFVWMMDILVYLYYVMQQGQQIDYLRVFLA